VYVHVSQGLALDPELSDTLVIKPSIINHLAASGAMCPMHQCKSMMVSAGFANRAWSLAAALC